MNRESRRNPFPDGNSGETSLWHAISTEAVCRHLEVNPDLGLDPQEARRRLVRFGPNRLRVERKNPIWRQFLRELREPMVVLLLATGILYSAWGEPADALTIFLVILALTSIEMFNEHRAKRAIAGLRKLAEPTSAVRRLGREVEFPAEEVVVGDVVFLQSGRRVPADARILSGVGLAVDESSLTGESLPSEKDPNRVLPPETALADRTNLVFAGTIVSRGRGTAVVVATETEAELGRVAALAAGTMAPRTPLQRAMRELSGSLVWVAVGFSVAVPLLGWLLTDRPVQELLLTGLSLAFATIPEEMPIIITMVLALGGYRLSRQHAIVRKLHAVETLGAITVIATDKTGTLTENRMQVVELYPPGMQHRLLEAGSLCNDAGTSDGMLTGDPLETALLRAARDQGLDVVGLRASNPPRAEFTFDNTRRMMSAIFEHGGAAWVAVKGAPEEVLARSSRLRAEAQDELLTESHRQDLLSRTARMGEQGLRVIGLAEKTSADGRLSQAEAESDLSFLGLVGFADPPRPGVREAISACRTAGIRPIMVTGDHPQTALAIARQVGLTLNDRVLTGAELDDLSDTELQELVEQVSIIARATPEHKLRIVRILQARQERVAVTGDGVNDGPALVAADVGVALGETGTDVAREASDIVLADDNFATIVRAIGEGRALFANLRKGVRYYLACKVALILAMILPTLLGVPIPFEPIQIILMELFMDLAAAATFVAEPAETDLMRQPPRDPRAHFMDKAMIGSILLSAVGLFAAVSAAYLVTWYRGADLATARSVAFATWLLGHVLLAFNLRTERQPLSGIGPFTNRLMVVWGAATLAFVLSATLIPTAHAAFKTVSLTPGELGLGAVSALLGTSWPEIRKVIRDRSRLRPASHSDPKAGAPA